MECIGRAKNTPVKPNRRHEKKKYIYIYIWDYGGHQLRLKCAQVRHHSPAGTFTRVPGRCVRWSPTPPGPRWPPAKLEVLHLFRWYTHTHQKILHSFLCRNRSASHILHPSLHHFNSFYVKYCEILIPWRYVFMSHVNSVHSNKAESNEILRYLWGPKVFNMVKVVRCFVAA